VRRKGWRTGELNDYLRENVKGSSDRLRMGKLKIPLRRARGNRQGRRERKELTSALPVGSKGCAWQQDGKDHLGLDKRRKTTQPGAKRMPPTETGGGNAGRKV